MKKFVLTVSLLILLCVGCNDDSSSQKARTFYESLALNEPKTAVETFADAFQQNDFFTVYFILSPTAQFVVENNINLLKYGEFIKVTNREEAEVILGDTTRFQMMEEWEHGGMMAIYHFDSIMLAAKQHSAFLIDLSGDVSIIRSEQVVDGNDNSTVDVITIVEGIEGNVIFRMQQAPSGRWRVRQVIVPGGDEELIPWSVPSN